MAIKITFAGAQLFKPGFYGCPKQAAIQRKKQNVVDLLHKLGLDRRYQALVREMKRV